MVEKRQIIMSVLDRLFSELNKVPLLLCIHLKEKDYALGVQCGQTVGPFFDELLLGSV